MFTLYAIINDSGFNLWQTIADFETREEAEAYGEAHTRAYQVQTVTVDN